MKKQMLLLAVGLSFIFIMIIYLSNNGTTFAQECQVVRIIGMAIHNDIKIQEPNKTLRISKGDCVVWFNRAEGPNLQIVFEDGKACASAAKAPSETTRDFKMGYGTCFVSSSLPFAGTSSLRFLEKGSYKYTVESITGDHPELRGTKVTAGTILVE